MRSYVRLRLADGGVCELSHGDLIGRLKTAALCLDDGRVSEAHAMISLRGQELYLLSLRRRFAIDGKACAKVCLREGLQVELAEGLVVVVEEVVLPDELLGLEARGLPRQTLSRVCSIVTQPRLELLPRYSGDASAHVWSLGDSWRLKIGDKPTRELQPGASFEVDGVEIRAVTVSLASASESVTRIPGGIHAPLQIVTRYESVHIHRPAEPPLVLTGLSARLLSELAAFATPTSWEMVARELWTEDDRDALRRKWDITLIRLRRKLREARIRADLVRADGNGNIELCLTKADTVEDQG